MNSLYSALESATPRKEEGLPRSQSMKVLSLLIGSLMLAVMLSNAAYSSWTRKGKSEQPHMNRDKRCHDRLSITIFS
jgi:hypothetical protein